MPDELRQAFFEDLAHAMDDWVNATVQAIESPDNSIPWTDDLNPYLRLNAALKGDTSDLKLIMTEFARGLMHSALVALDGGTESAEVGPVAVVDPDGRLLADGLHELFVDHLFQTGRLQ